MLRGCVELGCALGWALGCAGSQASDQAESSPALDAGARCLRDAAAPRTPLEGAPPRVVVSHILVRHAELARPQGATRPPEAACLRALDALHVLQSGGSWEEVSAEYSDSQAGTLGEVSREDLEPAFADAAFSLEPNELSYVVETNRGFHIILRER